MEHHLSALKELCLVLKRRPATLKQLCLDVLERRRVTCPFETPLDEIPTCSRCGVLFNDTVVMKFVHKSRSLTHYVHRFGQHCEPCMNTVVGKNRLTDNIAFHGNNYYIINRMYQTLAQEIHRMNNEDLSLPHCHICKSYHMNKKVTLRNRRKNDRCDNPLAIDLLLDCL